MSAPAVAMECVTGTTRQQSPVSLPLQRLNSKTGGVKITSFQFWRFVVLLMLVGSALATGMWMILAAMGDFISIEHSSFRLQSKDSSALMPPAKQQDGLGSQCDGRRVYVYDIPAQFNSKIVTDFCSESYASLGKCESYVDGGFGKRIENFSEPLEAWYRTEQFGLEPIVHKRLKMYRCRTDNPAIADLYYMPYYVGLDLVRHVYDEQLQTRDLLS